ncbi:sodium:calcium antiporter [Candidatus Vallotia tarda]|uniref:Sodium/calcium exchanger membrane region n=1 Tax=Candidatus Vallotiella hemipterorum TaxID=1177213 RepID=A0A916JQU8_9BURK|nr:sodium:calcium antiporter [Candidatus Vallotia tarda]CAG7594765.1 Sodium/calcium exchanger membrane region [Candidatus Vallotia tarda]
MTRIVLQLILMLAAILIASALFTNALEHLGKRMQLSDGVTGSLLAAVGTALPETSIPLIAILSGHGELLNEEISIGAILGAPLMLATLSTCLMTVSVLGQRGLFGRIYPEASGIKRDLNYFLYGFFLSAVAMYVPHTHIVVRAGLSIALICVYLHYVYMTLQASQALVDSGHSTTVLDLMYLSHIGIQTRLITILLQLGIALVLLVSSAKGFMHYIDQYSQYLGVSPLLLSLIMIPIATELPEKINTILWVRCGKDTLAFSNLTGAMVFQGTILPALGIILTPWQPCLEALTSIAITLTAVAWCQVLLRDRGLPIWALLFNGIFYVAYLGMMLTYS